MNSSLGLAPYRDLSDSAGSPDNDRLSAIALRRSGVKLIQLKRNLGITLEGVHSKRTLWALSCASCVTKCIPEESGQLSLDACPTDCHGLPDAVRAHPRNEHLLPLFTAHATAGADAQPRPFHRGIMDHVIAMDGYTFDRSNSVSPILELQPPCPH
jgi:hypothetical protein